MKCSKCGTEYNDTFEFCPNCAEANPLIKKEEPTIVPEPSVLPIVEPKQQPQPIPQTPPVPPPPPILPPTPNKRTISDRWNGLSPRGKTVVAGIVVVILIIGIVGAVTGSGKKGTSTTKETPSATTDTTPNPQPTTTNSPAPAQPTTATPPAPAQPAVRTLTGNGNQATQAFSVSGGLVIFHMQSTSADNFSVQLMNQASGEQTALLANVIGNYAGSQAAGVNAGTYVFNVTCSGPWSIGIEEPNPSTAPSTPQTFTGGGPMATGFFTASNGLATFTMSHQGDGNFSVQVLDTDGNEVQLPANEIGVFQGSQAETLTAGDMYILNVDANGPWSVQVQ